MLCVGVALSLLTTIAEHIVYKLVIPRVKEPRFKYWLHTSQVTPSPQTITKTSSVTANGAVLVSSRDYTEP